MALVSTFNSMTEKFWGSKKITDAVTKGDPVLTELFKRAKPGGGKKIIFDIEYNLQDGGSRALTGQMTATTPEIITQGEMDWRDYYIWCQMEKAYVFENKHDPNAIASYFDTRVSNAVKSMKERLLAPAALTAQTSTNWDSLIDACGDSATYANIAIADLPAWRAMIGEAAYSNGASTGVSPSLENVKKMLRLMQTYTRELPHVILATPDLYDKLSEQITANDQVSAKRAGDNVAWGFAEFSIGGVPVITSPNFNRVATFAAGAATANRVNCAGDKLLFINWNYIDLMYLPEWFCKWDDEGWRSPLDYTQYINQLHCASNIVCRSRRHQGAMFGIDVAQSVSSWTLIPDAQVNLTHFAIPASS